MSFTRKPGAHLSQEAAIAHITFTIRVFYLASIACAGLQAVMYLRNVFILYTPHGENALETVLGALPGLALQVIGCMLAFGAGPYKISCMILNIVASTICLLLMLFV